MAFNRRRETIFFFYIILLALLPSEARFAAAQNGVEAVSGYAMVQRLLPTLVEAFVAAIGLTRTQEYLEPWIRQDVEYLVERIQFADVDDNGEDSATDRPNVAVERAIGRSGNIFLGSLGEIFGLQQLRTQFRSQSSIRLIDDGFLRALNRGRRPDALAYSVDGDRLIIHAIMESKMGTAEIRSAQMVGILRNFQVNGLRLESHAWGAQNIFLAIELPGAPHLVRIDMARLEDLPPIVLVIRSVDAQPRVFYNQRRTPVSAEEIVAIHSRYIASRRGVADSTELAERVSARRRAILRPAIDALNEWIGRPRNRRLPTAMATDPEERHLGDWVNNHGGQKFVFNNYLSAESRNLFAVRMLVEPAAVLNEWIARHRRFPSNMATDGTERKLGTWVSTQGGQRAVFDDRLTAANRSFFAIRILVDAVALLNEWVDNRMCFPSSRSNDPEETKLGEWIQNHGGQSRIFHHNLTPMNRTHFMVRVAVEPVLVLNEWIAQPQNQRFPSQKSNDSNERWLGKWIGRNGGQEAVFQRDLTPENRNHFQIQFAAQPTIVLNEWISRNQRFPRQRSTDLDEARLGRWVSKNGGHHAVYISHLSEANRQMIAFPNRPDCIVEVLDSHTDAVNTTPSN